MMKPTKQTSKLYCNTLAMAKGLDPIGNAGTYDTAFALELPLPWPHAILLEPERLPPELAMLIQKYFNMPASERPAIRPLFIAPDPEYSVVGYRRVIRYTKPDHAFAEFERIEYLVPEAEVGKLLVAQDEGGDAVHHFDQYRVDADGVRDLMVCTHGSRDVACGKFGYQSYDYLRRRHASDTVRVWRVNHFGGHVFAPTLLDMPKGDSWAFVDEDVADSIATRSGDLDDVTRRYRGWSGCDTRFAESAERAVWQREGWAWQAYDKQTHTYNIEETRQPTFADVRIEYTSPDGATRGVYEAHVVIEKHIATIPSTGSADEHAYPQYRVTEIERVP